MKNTDGFKTVETLEVKDDNCSSKQPHPLENILNTALPNKPAFVSRRYLKRRRRVLSAYKNGNGLTRHQLRRRKLANRKNHQTSEDNEDDTTNTIATEIDSETKHLSTFKIRFQHQDCEQRQNNTKDTKANYPGSQRSNHIAHDDSSQENLTGNHPTEYNDDRTKTNEQCESTALNLPRLPEMQGSGVIITQTPSGKLIRAVPGSKSSNWIMVGCDGNHHLRQPTPVPPCFDNLTTTPLPPIQDSLSEVLEWGLKTNKLTLSALMQVDHKHACNQDETFDFSRELQLESQRLAAETSHNVEQGNCCRDTDAQISDEKSRSGQGQVTDHSEDSDTKCNLNGNYSQVEKQQETDGAGEDEGESRDDRGDKESDDNIDYCRTPTVILTPTKTMAKPRRQPDVTEFRSEPDVQSKKIRHKDQVAPKNKRQKHTILPRLSRSTLPVEADFTEPISRRTFSEGVCTLPQIPRSISPSKATKIQEVLRRTLCSQSPILPRIPNRKFQDASLWNNVRPKGKRKRLNSVEDTGVDNESETDLSYTAFGKECQKAVASDDTDTATDLELDDKPADDRSESQIRQRLLDRMEFECQNEVTSLFDDDKTLQRAVELRNLAMHPQEISPPPSTPCQIYRNTSFDSDLGNEFHQQNDGNFYISDSYASDSTSHKTLMEQLRPTKNEMEHIFDKSFSRLGNKRDDELTQRSDADRDWPKAVKSVRFAELPPKRKILERSKSDPTHEGKRPTHSDEWNDCFLVAIGKSHAIKKEPQSNQSKSASKNDSYDGDDKSDITEDDQFDAELIEREMKRYLHWLRHDRAIEQHRWFSANVSHRHLPMTTHQVPQPLIAVNNQLTESSISAKVARALGMYSVLPKPDFDGPPHAGGTTKAGGVVRFARVPVLPPIAGSNEMLFRKTFAGEIKGVPLVASSKHKRNKRESNKCPCKKGK